MSLFKPWTWFRRAVLNAQGHTAPSRVAPGATSVPSWLPVADRDRAPKLNPGAISESFVEGVSIPVLVVVDMQPYFGNSQIPEVMENVIRQMKVFIANGWPIVILEYNNCGASDPRIDALVETPEFRYPHLARMVKSDDDGSNEVFLACKKYGFGMGFFRACGVNSTACVLATVQGLNRIAPNALVEVVREACGPATDFGQYPKQPNVAIRTVQEADTAEAAKLPNFKLPDLAAA